MEFIGCLIIMFIFALVITGICGYVDWIES